MSWTNSLTERIERVISSHVFHLLMTVAITGFTVGTTIVSYQSATHKRHAQELRDSVPVTSQHGTSPDFFTSDATSGQTPGRGSEDVTRDNVKSRELRNLYDNELILEQLARNRVFLGENGLHHLRSAFIVVVGCGGVGSHAAAALARSGVSRLRLIDFDQVTLSSLNRHAVATIADVGISKVSCLRKRLTQAVPWLEIDARNEVFCKDSAESQLSMWADQRPTFIIDAIDNIDSKVDLLSFCHINHLPVISSMGAGTKSDPTRIFVGDISMSNEDPLSRSTRRRLRLRGITSGIPAVFSIEKSAPEKASLLPLAETDVSQGHAADLGVLPNFRARVLPVLGTIPAIFGLCVANHVILTISQYPYEYMTGKSRDKTYEAILGNLQASEERLARWAGLDSRGLRLPISLQDVGYIVDEIYRGKSIVSGLTTRLTLVRWQRPETGFFDTNFDSQKFSKLCFEQLVVMTKDEGIKHEENVLKAHALPENVYESHVIETVSSRQKEIQEHGGLR